jgi:hypothetical protein
MAEGKQIKFRYKGYDFVVPTTRQLGLKRVVFIADDGEVIERMFAVHWFEQSGYCLLDVHSGGSDYNALHTNVFNALVRRLWELDAEIFAFGDVNGRLISKAFTPKANDATLDEFTERLRSLMRDSNGSRRKWFVVKLTVDEVGRIAANLINQVDGVNDAENAVSDLVAKLNRLEPKEPLARVNAGNRKCKPLSSGCVMKDADSKRADFNVTVDAEGVDRFAFPKRDDMIQCEFKLEVRGKRFRIRLVLYSHVEINGKIYTCVAVLTNDTPGVYVTVRDHVLRCLGKARRVGLWFGDLNNTLTRARTEFSSVMSESNIKKVFNDHTQGTAWTRTVCFLVEGRVNLQRLLVENRPSEVKPVTPGKRLKTFADYQKDGLTPPKPGTRISLSMT